MIDQAVENKSSRVERNIGAATVWKEKQLTNLLCLPLLSHDYQAHSTLDTLVTKVGGRVPHIR